MWFESKLIQCVTVGWFVERDGSVNSHDITESQTTLNCSFLRQANLNKNEVAETSGERNWSRRETEENERMKY